MVHLVTCLNRLVPTLDAEFLVGAYFPTDARATVTTGEALTTALVTRQAAARCTTGQMTLPLQIQIAHIVR